MDYNKDGFISKAEMLAAVLDTAFTSFDKNQDDMLEWQEVYAAIHFFRNSVVVGFGFGSLFPHSASLRAHARLAGGRNCYAQLAARDVSRISALSKVRCTAWHWISTMQVCLPAEVRTQPTPLQSAPLLSPANLRHV